MALTMENSRSFLDSLLRASNTSQTLPVKTVPEWSINDTRLHLPKWYVPAFFVVVVGALALPYGKTRIYTSLPIVLAFVAMLPYYTEGSFKKDFDLGNLIFGWFLMYLSLILTAPEKVFWKRDGRDVTPEERMRELERRGFWGKLAWSWGVYSNPRGLGWSHQVPGLRHVEAGISVWKFVLEKLAYALTFSVAIDLLTLWYKHLQSTGTDAPWTILAEPIPMQILIGLSNIFRIFFEMASMHSLAAAATTAVGMYQPSDWPPIVGSLRDAYTLKRFWGMVFHKFMRGLAHAGGLLLSRDIVAFPKGSFPARSLYLLGGFLTPGLYHTMVSIYATGFRAGVNPCGDLLCFVLQAVGVLVEGWAIDAVKCSGHGGNTRAWKLFGYIWCACFLGYSQLGYIDGLTKAGLWDVDLRVLSYLPGASV